MGKSIKIAIYTGTVPSATFIERLIKGLAENSLQVYLFGIQKKKILPVKNIYNITYSNKLGKLMFFIKYSLLLTFFKAKDKRKLDDIILNKNKNTRYLKIKYYPVLYHRPDIFHLQWAKSIEDWIWVQEFGIKLIVSLLGTHLTISPIGDEHWGKVYSKYFPKVDGFHAVSNSMITIAERFRANREKVIVIKSVIETDKLMFTQKMEIGKPLKVLSIGRSHWVKGYSYALDAMNLLMKDKIDFTYTIVGVENDEELLYKRSHYGLEDRISFKNNMPFLKVKELIKNANVMLLSSVEEGIANVVLEAMALGTLVISTDCGGMKEAITDKENGFLVSSRNPVAIASAVKNVTELSIENYRNITKAARDTIVKQHNQDEIILEMKNLYHNVLKNKL